MRLRSRLHEDEVRSASLTKFRVGSWGRSSSSPLMNKTSQTSLKQGSSPAASPDLVAQDAGGDLLFEMDEEKVYHRGLPDPRSDPSSPALQAQDLQNVLGVENPNPDADGCLDARGKPLAGSVSTDASSIGTSFHRPQYSSSPTASRTPQSSTLTSGFTFQNTPWSAVRSLSSRTDLRDIMAEDSISRRSNLTLAMNDKSSEQLRGIQKMSQKERKRNQKQQFVQDDESSSAPTPSASASKAPAPHTSIPTSPWRPIRPSPRADLSPSVSSGVDQPEMSTKPPMRPPTRTTMTMRQTVAGTPSIDKSKSTTSKQLRTVSNPSITPLPGPAPPQIQSIQHSPAPATTSLAYTDQNSMTDILHQQQKEKTAVKEAVAKRSLQEIQQQQEFEEWFDSEARRVQEEEAQAAATAAAVAASKDGRGKRGRGRGGHRRGGGRGNTNAGSERALTSPTTHRGESLQGQGSESTRGGNPDLRGRGRGVVRDGPA